MTSKRRFCNGTENSSKGKAKDKVDPDVLPKDIIDMAGERTRGKGPIGKDAFLMDETKPQISEVEGGEKVDYDLKTVPILARYLNIPSHEPFLKKRAGEPCHVCLNLLISSLHAPV